MAKGDLSLNDLAESLALLRGNQGKTREFADRPADPLEIAIFDQLRNTVVEARKQRFSKPGGPNETGMSGRRFPMHSLEREESLDEILRFKAEMLAAQFRRQQARRNLTRALQKVPSK